MIIAPCPKGQLFFKGGAGSSKSEARDDPPARVPAIPRLKTRILLCLFAAEHDRGTIVLVGFEFGFKLRKEA
jgi:hypothetical protein